MYRLRPHDDRHRPLVIITLHFSQNDKWDTFQPLSKMLADEALQRLNLKFNIPLLPDSIKALQFIAEHVEGLVIAMSTCKDLTNSVRFQARFLTLHLNTPVDEETSFDLVAAQFQHTNDLRLIMHGTHNLSHEQRLCSGVRHFENLTSLSMKLSWHGTLDLKMLKSLHMLRLESNRLPDDLWLPESIQNFAIEAIDPDSTQQMTLSAALQERLNSLPLLMSIAIRSFILRSDIAVLEYFPAGLRSLDVGTCSLHHSGSLGKPHSKLNELRIGYIYGKKEHLTNLRLQVLSCAWSMLCVQQHADHLRVLWIAPGLEASRKAESLKQLSSLTELWMPTGLLTESAVKNAEIDGEILKVFPPTLEILVLYEGSYQALDGQSWDFRSLKHLRSIGLYHGRMCIEPKRLPQFLRTIAVSRERSVIDRKILGRSSTKARLTIMTHDDWTRGPLPGRFFAFYTEDSRTDGLGDLLARQHHQDARHHRMKTW